MIDVLTLNYNDSITTISFINSIKDYSSIRYIVVVDNASTDGSYDRLKDVSSDKIVIILNSNNLGYGGGNNVGIKYAYNVLHSDYLLLCNPDVIINDEVILKMESFLECNKDFSIIAPLMKDKNGVLQYNTAINIPSLFNYILSLGCLYSKIVTPQFFPLNKIDYNRVNVVGSVAGSCFLMDTKSMIEKGMFDENIFLYGEEIVLGIKMRIAHLKIGLLPNMSYIHNHSVTISKTYNSAYKKQKLLIKSKLYIIEHYYHANMVEKMFAKLLSLISLLEVLVISRLKR